MTNLTGSNRTMGSLWGASWKRIGRRFGITKE